MSKFHRKRLFAWIGMNFGYLVISFLICVSEIILIYEYDLSYAFWIYKFVKYCDYLFELPSWYKNEEI